MTEPGSIIPPSPSWWIRTGRHGVASGVFGWSTRYAQAVASPTGYKTGQYGWDATAVGKRPVAYSQSAMSAYQSAVTPPFTWPQYVEPESYGIVMVVQNDALTHIRTPPDGTATVTLGGITLTELGYVNNNDSVAWGWTWVFGGDLSALQPGSKTVSVTLSDGNRKFSGYGASFTYTNVTAVGTLQTAFDYDTNPLVTVTSAPTRTVWGAINNTSQTQSAFSLSSRRNNSGVNVPKFVAGDIDGTASVDVSCTIGVTDYWSAVGLDLT